MTALAAAVALGIATQAPAESLDLEEIAAALALPVITGGADGSRVPDDTAITINTITNGSMGPIILKVDVITGDPGERWSSTSFECPLTGRETVAFLFVEDGDGSVVYAECNELAVPRLLEAENGIMFVGVSDPFGIVVSEDVIFGDSIVIAAANGGAYSVGAVPFQAGVGPNDGDKVYSFDGVEYAQFPSLLATNFLAPTDTVVAELILFTLDGTTGTTPVPRVLLTGIAFNDDEIPVANFQHTFDCFDIVALEDLDGNFTGSGPGQPGLGSFVGHLQLRAQPTGRGNAVAFDVHDSMYGNGDNLRTTPAAGWITQAVIGGPALDNVLEAGALFANSPEAGTLTPVAWGRPLAVSRTAVMPYSTDDPATLNADPNGP